MYKGFSHKLNDLINLYFSVTNEGMKSSVTYLIEELEIQVAGSEDERKVMMPLQYIDSFKERANAEVRFH